MKRDYLCDHAHYEALLINLVRLDRIVISKNLACFVVSRPCSLCGRLLTRVDELLRSGFPSFLCGNLLFDFSNLDSISTGESRKFWVFLQSVKAQLRL